MEHFNLLFKLGKKVLTGGHLNFDEAMSLTEIDETEVPILLGIANNVRARFTGDQMDTCEILNARSGNCSENCKFCVQSGHHEVKFNAHALLTEDDIVAAAKKAEEDGAGRFCIVTAGKGMDGDPDFVKIIAAIERIGRETSIKRCCSLGTLADKHVAALKAAGITRYHHNIETSESNFSNICTTHSYEERIATIRRIKAAGIQACSGGIIGLGESWQQRLEMAYALKELDVDSIPINVLNAVEGTALYGQTRLSPFEILQTFAIFRLVLPTKIIRYAGGREHNLGELVPLGLISGINGMLIGNYFTTAGRGAARDIATVCSMGMRPAS